MSIYRNKLKQTISYKTRHKNEDIDRQDAVRNTGLERAMINALNENRSLLNDNDIKWLGIMAIALSNYGKLSKKQLSILQSIANRYNINIY